MLQLRQGFRCRDSVLVWHEGPEAGGPEPRPGQRVELQIYQTVPLTPRQRRQQGTNLFPILKPSLHKQRKTDPVFEKKTDGQLGISLSFYGRQKTNKFFAVRVNQALPILAIAYVQQTVARRLVPGLRSMCHPPLSFLKTNGDFMNPSFLRVARWYILKPKKPNF
jgi:hypothetical protein